MHSLATTAVPITDATPATTSATSSDTSPDHSTTKQGPALTQDFYLDTFFNPVWTSGPHVFSFDQSGTVIRPKTCASEPYHVERTGRLDFGSASQFQNVWKYAALPKRNDGTFEVSESCERQRVEEWRRDVTVACGPSMPDEPEFIYTWPPEQHKTQR